MNELTSTTVSMSQALMLNICLLLKWGMEHSNPFFDIDVT